MRQFDPEVSALKRVYKIMSAFDYATKARILQWLQQRFDSDEQYRGVLERTGARVNRSSQSESEQSTQDRR